MFVTASNSVEHIFDGEGPPDLGSYESNHTNLVFDPLNSVTSGIVEDRPLGHCQQSGLHFFVYFVHPLFDLALWFQWSFKFVFLTFVRLHANNDLVVIGEVQPLATIKETEKERLNGKGVGATENLQQVIVGDEVESWEAHLLCLQVVGQRLLAPVQLVSNVLKVLASGTIVSFDAGNENVGLLESSFHNLLEGLVSLAELFGLVRQLHFDIIR